MSQDDHYTGALLEEIRDQNKALLEGQAALQGLPTAVAQLGSKVDQLSSKLEAATTAIKDTNSQVQDHERRLVQFETAA